MNNVNFVSIPRTGTNSVYSILGGVDGRTNHKSIRLTNDDRFSFAVLRNPAHRLMSWWKFHSTPSYDPTGMIYGSSFAEWVRNGCSHHWSSEFTLDRGISNPLNQWEFVCGHDYKEVLVDQLIDFNNLQIEFAKYLAPYLKQTDLPLMNRSNPSKTVSMNADILKRIKQRFWKDYELYESLKK